MTASLTRDYVVSAATGMLVSLHHYGDSSPAVGDGRVSTPAWYANRLGKVLHATGDSLPGESTQWWGHRFGAYARTIVALTECEYFAGCTNLADGVVVSPITSVGNVPTCQRCARRMEVDLIR